MTSDAHLKWEDGHWWWWSGTDWSWWNGTDWELFDVVTQPVVSRISLPEVTTPAAASLTDRMVPFDTAYQAHLSPSTNQTTITIPQGNHVGRRVLIGLVLLALLGGGIYAAVANLPAFKSSPSPSGSPSPSSSVSAGTTLGSALSDFQLAHTLAPGYPAGTAFDPDPQLPALGGQAGARFSLVIATSGQITSYRITLTPGADIISAKVQVANTLPNDAVQAWVQAKNACLIVGMTSAVIATEVGGDPTGGVLIVYRSGTVTFDATNVVTARVYAEPSSNPPTGLC
ncbi:MAG: hypothetical protein WCJ42_10225 [Actinomycetes bacterium]